MPQLVKGGKWAYGWVTVGPSGEVVIPPETWLEYDFQAGDVAIFLAGSRSSGGFAIGSASTLEASGSAAGGHGLRELARGHFVSGQVRLPPQVCARPGDRLLAVRGSRLGLGFVGRGRIFEEAIRQADRLQVFGPGD